MLENAPFLAYCTTLVKLEKMMEIVPYWFGCLEAESPFFSIALARFCKDMTICPVKKASSDRV